MVIPYIVGQNDKKIPYTSKIPLIAPAQFAYQVQPALINAYATKNLGEVSVSNVSLHCGNGDANGS
ncbi:hypothetical protein IJM86_08940 [bacterium]|nr:hypothetical protein [bacterium]